MYLEVFHMAKRDYKIAVLNYLKDNANKDITRNDLITNTNISKSRLSEVLNSIKDDGFTIISPPRSGFIRLEMSDEDTVLPALKDSDLRQWIIILLLSIYGELTFKELIIKALQLKDYEYIDANFLLDLGEGSSYDDNHLIKSLREKSKMISEDSNTSVADDYLSVTSMRKDLFVLRNMELVQLVHGEQTKYSLTATAPYIIPINEDSLYEFCQRHEANFSTTSELLPIKLAYQKIKNLVAYEQYDFEQRRFGKFNQINKEQIDKFNIFISHPYSTNVLQLNSSYNGIERQNAFATALLFYCVETSSFYALGYSFSHARTEAIRIDWISSIIDLPKDNEIYHSPEYYAKYDEMFSAGYDDTCYSVKVLFQEFGNIYTRFTNLANVRKNAVITLIENIPDDCIYKYVYTDKIRGLSDFARFLRGFGYSALAVEPPELKQMMINTYTRSLTFYEEGNDDE